jgi:hypothetical protein
MSQHFKKLEPGAKVYAIGFTHEDQFEIVRKLRPSETPWPHLAHFVCRLRCTFLTKDQLWIFPALHLLTKPPTQTSKAKVKSFSNSLINSFILENGYLSDTPRSTAKS